jgi:hypothetical protein
VDGGRDGVLEIPGITPGNHTVQLVGLEITCVIEGGRDSRTLEIPPGEVIRLDFRVSCVTPEQFSTLAIQVNNAGVGSDDDGFIVWVDEGEW